MIERGGLLLAAVLPICFNPFSTSPFEAKLTMLWAVVLVMAAAGMVNEGLKAFRVSDNFIGVPCAMFGAALIVSTVFSIDRSKSLSALLVELTAIVLFFLLVPRLRHAAYRSKLVDAIIIGSVPVAVYALLQFFGVDPMDWLTDSIFPMSSTIGRSNFVGAYLAMVIPFSLLRHRTWPLACLQVLVVLLCQARAAWLGLIVGMFLVAGRKHRSASVGVLVLGAVLYLAVSDFDFRERLGFEGQKVSEARESSNMYHVIIWRQALEQIPNHPFIGHGPGIGRPHNIVLKRLYSTGIVGLMAWLTVLAVFYFKASRDKTTTAAIASSATFIVHGLFSPVTLTLTVVFWIALAVGVGGGRWTTQPIRIS
jgi:O-antigen ligase